LRLFSFGGYGLALAALALVVFGAYDSYPTFTGLVIPTRGFMSEDSAVLRSFNCRLCVPNNGFLGGRGRTVAKPRLWLHLAAQQPKLPILSMP